MKRINTILIFLFLFSLSTVFSKVKLGVDIFFERHLDKIKNKNIGVITNHTGIDSNLNFTSDLFIKHKNSYKLKAFFSPEHGINGAHFAGENVKNSKYKDISIYSLHGKTRRPTKKMLENIDILIFDIQDLGSRSYTYLTTLLYVIEEAARNKIKVIVLDRPNPINGIIVDGPLLEKKYRSFIGYINVPYCHGMTIGELATFYNRENKIGCDLFVVRMVGWRREMSFMDTDLTWIPTSPNIPEPDTPFFYPTTGILGELKISNIGIGYTLPFKVVGAPWIDGEKFSKKLNEQNLPGVKFFPFSYKPFTGLYKNQLCSGVKIIITDKKKYRPLSTQYLLLGMMKSMYRDKFLEKLDCSKGALDLFCKANGTNKIYEILKNEKYPAWKMIEYDKEKRKIFLEKRKKYLFKEYK